MGADTLRAACHTLVIKELLCHDTPLEQIHGGWAEDFDHPGEMRRARRLPARQAPLEQAFALEKVPDLFHTRVSDCSLQFWPQSDEHTIKPTAQMSILSPQATHRTISGAR